MARNPTADYTVDQARGEFERGVYSAVIAMRLGGGKTESDVWNLAESEGWLRPAGEKREAA